VKVSLRDLIREAMKRLGGRGSVSHIYALIHADYPDIRYRSISRSMRELARNRPSRSRFSQDEKILWKVGRGVYELYSEERHGRAMDRWRIRFCDLCGQEIRPENKFCDRCGRRLV
jgi:hypothetical protein